MERRIPTPVMAAPGLHRLEPHDPLPERGPYVLVIRRFGEDDPKATVVEIIVDDGTAPRQVSVPAASDGSPADLGEALHQAVTLARSLGIAAIYAVDRMAGPRERAVRAHGGDHDFDETPLADGEPGEGADLRDRPRDAGYLR